MDRRLKEYSTYRHTDKKRRYTNKEGDIRLVQGNFDPLICFCTVLLVLFGILMVFSATYYRMGNSAVYNYDSYYYLKRNVLFSGMGIVAMFIVSTIPYGYYKRVYKLCYIASVVLLLAVLFFGKEVNGAKRWLFGFQPSELSKILMIIFLAEYICIHKSVLTDFREFAVCCLCVLFPIGLIAVENLSTAIVMSAICFGMLFVAGASFRFFVPLCILGVVGVLTMTFGEGFRAGRVSAWLDPFSDPSDTGYQIVQSLYAIASGGMFGLGIGQSRQKMYMPEAHNDIIFAIVCEELGLIGAAIIVFLFVVLIYRCARAAMKSYDNFAMLTASGITIMIATQVAINLAVVTNSMPNTGIPLPFISYGGTSMLIMLSSMGVILNISRHFKDTM